MDHWPQREPILNVPAVVVVLLAVLGARARRARLAAARRHRPRAGVDLAFVPARYDASALTDGILPGGWGAEIWTFVTYALLHADWTHLGFNAVWLLAFASPVARRFGALRFLLFFAVTIAGGALAYLLAHAGALAPMIGASAGISGMMGAAARFAFQPGGSLDYVAARSRQRRPGSGGAASCCAAQSARPDICRRLVRSQPAVRARLGVVYGRRKSERRLGGPCRRLSRRPVAVFAVRSGAAARRSPKIERTLH